MMITLVNRYNCLKNDFKINTFGSHKEREVYFKGADTFDKKNKLPDIKESYNILNKNVDTKMSKHFDIATLVSDELYNEKVYPLIRDKYPDEYAAFCQFVSKAGPHEKLCNLMNSLYGYMFDFWSDMEPYQNLRNKYNNSLTIISKDKELANGVLDFLPSFMKLKTFTKQFADESGTKLWHDYIDSFFKNRFIEIDKKDLPDTADKTKIYEILKDSENFHKETGGYTALRIKEIEKLLNPKTESSEDIAAMKLIMQCCAKDNNVMFLNAISDPNKCARGFNTAGRFGYPKFDLDKLGLDKNDIQILSRLKKDTEVLADEVDKIFKSDRRTNIIGKKLDEINTEWLNNRRILKELYNNPENNKENILNFIAGLQVETEEIEKEPLEATYNKMFKINITEKPLKKVVEQIKNQINGKSGKKVSFLGQIKNIIKNNKVAILSIIAIVSAAGFVLLKNKAKTNKNNSTTIVNNMLLNLSF